jgi:methylenetetrahydrofolate dehydrogenase (NADP+)/methenyltetrahydrofolate cyclohydrolase
MAATILDGKALAKSLRTKLATEVAEITAKLGRPPGLSVVLVGEDPASKIYVRNKEKAAKEVGVVSEVIRLPATSTQEAVVATVERLNKSESVDAFLVQLPLPPGLDERAVTDRIAPAKDGDGLHPTNLGRLLAGLAAPRPCTPAGIMHLLDEADVPLKGKRAVVVGRSTIVGKPVALMLLERHATVTLCHSRTQDLAAEVRRADVVVAAVGQANLIRGDWIADGAVVIDVGMNRVDGKLTGDVEYEAAALRASAITPVPGGVGPMTVALLLHNTVQAAKHKISARP